MGVAIPFNNLIIALHIQQRQMKEKLTHQIQNKTWNLTYLGIWGGGNAQVSSDELHLREWVQSEIGLYDQTLGLED